MKIFTTSCARTRENKNMDTFRNHFKKNKGVIISLALILLAGVFLRTYAFHDWLRFSGDQARDAAIIRAAIEHEAPLPLLGPLAGGTNFFIGSDALLPVLCFGQSIRELSG